MKRKNSELRIAVVCMVQNGEEYISEFLLYHLNLVDHIFLIDHNSKRDLRNLDLPKVTVLRSNHVAQFQSECTNLVIGKLGLQNHYDWLFVLDIDEFLPFQSRRIFHHHLEKWSGDKVLHFTWRNGVPVFLDNHAGNSPKSLIDCPNIIFHKYENPTLTAFVNLKKIGQNFCVQTGAHHISKKRLLFNNRLKRFDRWAMFPSTPTGLSLFHIVSFDKEKFVEKIQKYVRQMEMRSHVVGQGGWMVRNYPQELNGEEWLWYVANFRLSDKRLHHRALPEDFVPTVIFDHLNRAEVTNLRQRIGNLPLAENNPESVSESERAYLTQKTDDTSIRENLRWFDVNVVNEIVSVRP